MRLARCQTFVFVTALILFLGRCGHTIPGALTGDGKPYDFREKRTCVDPGYVDGKVQIRYLGSGGIYLRWGYDAILLGPSFSNPNMARALVAHVKPIRDRIDRGLAQVQGQYVRAILTGHAHYDHMGDVPEVARRYPEALIYVNQSGANALGGEKLDDRIRQLKAGEWFDAAPSIRVTPVISGHAPQLCPWRRFPCLYADGDVKDRWDTPLPKHRLISMRRGQPFAFAIELRDAGETRYRIYYNDSSADSPLGQTAGPFDLAILTMAQWKWVRDYPRDLLRVLQPRHVLVSHWDNFFAETRQETRFVGNLSNTKAADFLKIVDELVNDEAGPVHPVCGAMNQDWTMPAPGTSMLFSPEVQR